MVVCLRVYSGRMTPSSSNEPRMPPIPYEPPKLTELGTLHEITLAKYLDSTDGYSFTGPRIVSTSR